jgi:hypothetical protein
VDRAGSKRTLGVALLGTGAIMLVLSAVFWTGVIAIAPESRPILGAALLVAGLIDVAIGVKFLQSA